MKRSTWVFIVAGLVLLSSLLWFLSSFQDFRKTDLIHFGVIILLIAFGLYIGFRRWFSEKRGEPAEDELSKELLRKSAALSYYISLYIWVFLIYLKDRIKFDTEELLGTGILAMAATFAITWLFYNFRGVKND